METGHRKELQGKSCTPGAGGGQRETYCFSSHLSLGMLLTSDKAVEKVLCCGAWFWAFEFTDGEQAHSLSAGVG